jgi:hypothetical protein
MRLSGEIQRFAAEILRALNLDEHAVSFLFRIAIFLRLNHATPDLFVYGARLVDFRDAVKAGDAALRQDAGLPQFRLSKEDSDLGAVGQTLVGRSFAALPNCEVLIIEHHRAAAWSHLGKSIRQYGGEEADIYWKCSVDMFVEDFRYFGHARL